MPARELDDYLREWSVPALAAEFSAKTLYLQRRSYSGTFIKAAFLDSNAWIEAHGRDTEPTWFSTRSLVEPTDATPESFVLRANRLDRAGHRNAGMDLLYDQVDQRMREGRFQTLDATLQSVPLRDLTVDILLGLLTATLPARNKLPYRPVFFERIRQVILDRGEYEEGLLTGLD